MPSEVVTYTSLYHHIPVMVLRGVLNFGMLSMGAFLLHSIVVSAAESLTVDP